MNDFKTIHIMPNIVVNIQFFHLAHRSGHISSEIVSLFIYIYIYNPENVKVWTLEVRVSRGAHSQQTEKCEK